MAPLIFWVFFVSIRKKSRFFQIWLEVVFPVFGISRVYFLRISTFRSFVSKQFFQMAVFGGEIFRHVGEPKGIF